MAKAVSLHLGVEVAGQTLLLCQARGQYNFEPKEGVAFGRRESWPGGLQPAVHGKLQEEDQDDPLRCLFRESEEEVGRRFTLEVLRKHQESIRSAGTFNDVAHFYLRVTPEDVPLICLHASSGGIRILRQADFDGVQDLKSLPKAEVVPANVNAMFLDDLAAMRQAYNELQQ